MLELKNSDLSHHCGMIMHIQIHVHLRINLYRQAPTKLGINLIPDLILPYPSYQIIPKNYRMVEFEGKLAGINSSRWERGMQAVWIFRREEWVYQELISSLEEEEECCINGENIVLVNPMLKPHLIFLYDLKKKWWRAIEILGLSEKDRLIAIYSYNKESRYSLRTNLMLLCLIFN